MFKVCQKLCKIILQVLQNFTNLQSCRSSFSAGWRPNFASKYATCSPCRELHAPPAFAPLRVEKFCKRSAKKSTASPNFRQISTQTCKMQGLVRGWIEAKFCNKIRNGQFSPRSTRNPSFCTARRRKFFETVREEVASFAVISKKFLKIFF